jgi:voltage-gated potassium channel
MKPQLLGMSRATLRRVAFVVLLALILCAAGTIGFHHLLREQWHEAFYRTAVTVTLTGLDTSPGREGAEILTVVLALGGVAILGYAAARAAESIAHEVAGDTRRDRKRLRMIGELTDHFIICGYGRVGRRAAEEFEASGQPYVVLDTGEEAVEIARERGVLYRRGSGAEDGELQLVGIANARGLLASADSDAENLYITLSARAQRPDLTIVARASTQEAERKLLLAGADRIVQPYATAGMEMATLALKPQVAAFLELVSSHTGPDLRFEEIEVSARCPQAGRSIRELRIRSTTGAVVIALRKGDGSFDVTPSPDEKIEPGDVLIAIGTEPELKALEDLFAPEKGG